MKPALALFTVAVSSCSSGPAAAIGLAAIFALMASLSHFWAGLAATLVAASSPSFYVKPSSSNGDAWVPLAVAVSGLGIAALGSAPCGGRWSALAVGVAGLALSWRASGALFGVFLPAASVTLAWALAPRQREGRAAAHVAGAAAAVGLALEALAAFGVCRGGFASAYALSGAAASRAHSFDYPIGELARAFFPWSALLPLSFPALVELPARAPPSPVAERESQSALRVLLATGCVLSYGLSALPTSSAQPAAVGGLIFVAGAVGVGLSGNSLPASRAGAVGSALLVALVGLDFLRLPAARLEAFTATSPLTSAPATSWFVASAALTLAGVLVGYWQRSPRPVFVGSLLGACVLRWAHGGGAAHGMPEWALIS